MRSNRCVVARAGALAALVLVAGCEPETPQGAATEETTRADLVYDPAAYDTVVWASDEEAVARGRDIFQWACAECHGTGGAGDGGRVIDGDTLRPPSFLTPDWEYAEDPDALHRKVFVGNELGMPHWGLRQMRPRDIVAVERYIRVGLRSEG